MSDQSKPPRKRRWLLCGVVLAAVLVLLTMGRTAAVSVIHWRARVNLASREPERALDWLRFGARLDPTDGETLFLRARANRKLGRMDKVRDLLAAAWKAGYDPRRIDREQWFAAAQTGSVKDLERHLSQLFVESGDDVAEACEAYVNGCILNYRFDEARTILGLWESDFPRDPLPHFMRARVLEHLNQWDEAEAEYHRTLELQPRHAAAAYGLARLAMMNKKTEEALQYYRQCESDSQHKGPAQVGIAHCLRLLNRPREARVILQDVLTRPTDELETAFRQVGEPAERAHTAAQVELGLLELAEKNYEQAVEWLRPAVAADPFNWRSRYELAMALRGLGRRSEAEAEFARVNQTKAALDRLDDAMDDLRADPKSADLRFTIGEIFLKHISENQGLVWLQGALYFDPTHAPTHRLLAEYYERNADQDPRFAAAARQHRQLAEKGSRQSEPVDAAAAKSRDH